VLTTVAKTTIAKASNSISVTQELMTTVTSGLVLATQVMAMAHQNAT